MKASELPKATTHRTLLYGEGKTGKTNAALQLSKYRKIYYIGCEAGHTVLENRMFNYTKGMLDNIEIFDLKDSPKNPLAAMHIRKFFTQPSVNFCSEHSELNCTKCQNGDTFSLAAVEPEALIVIDSLTQLSNSYMNLILARERQERPRIQDFGEQGAALENLLSTIQTCRKNVIVITHVRSLAVTSTEEKLFPVGGTSNFSRNVSRYFDSVLYASISMGKHSIASSTTYNGGVTTGTRTGLVAEKMPMDEVLTSIYCPEVVNAKKTT